MEDLLQVRKEQLAHPVSGALLFTCNGRGPRMFDKPHHDASVVSKVFDAPALAGFFAAGEVGPGIVTAAVTTALAFGCASLTEFRGVAELGWIAGGGIMIEKVSAPGRAFAPAAKAPAPSHAS